VIINIAVYVLYEQMPGGAGGGTVLLNQNLLPNYR